jgi:hypothetical protein
VAKNAQKISHLFFCRWQYSILQGESKCCGRSSINACWLLWCIRPTNQLW